MAVLTFESNESIIFDVAAANAVESFIRMGA